MAQNVVIEHLGSYEVKKGAAITTASILSSFAGATAIEMASDGVNVSINATPMFTTQKGQSTYLSTGKTYVFDRDCMLVVGIYRSI